MGVSTATILLLLYSQYGVGTCLCAPLVPMGLKVGEAIKWSKLEKVKTRFLMIRVLYFLITSLVAGQLSTAITIWSHNRCQLPVSIHWWIAPRNTVQLPIIRPSSKTILESEVEGWEIQLKILLTFLATSPGAGVCWGCTGLRLLLLESMLETISLGLIGLSWDFFRW